MILATTRVGAGPRTVLLLHGFLGSGRNLATLARTWSAADPSRSFVLVDLTGHGQSPPLPPGAGLPTLATDLLETAATIAAPPYTVVGHSMGGRVALQALLLEPEKIRHITLLDIAPGAIGDAGDEHSRTMRAFAAVPDVFQNRDEARQALLAQGLSASLTEWLLTNLVSSDDGYRWRIDRHALQELRPRMNAADLWPAVERHAGVIRCIRAGRSSYVSAADADRLARLGSPVDVILDAGHFLHVDQPKALLDLLIEGTP